MSNRSLLRLRLMFTRGQVTLALKCPTRNIKKPDCWVGLLSSFLKLQTEIAIHWAPHFRGTDKPPATLENPGCRILCHYLQIILECLSCFGFVHLIMSCIQRGKCQRKQVDISQICGRTVYVAVCNIPVHVRTFPEQVTTML